MSHAARNNKRKRESDHKGHDQLRKSVRLDYIHRVENISKKRKRHSLKRQEDEIEKQGSERFVSPRRKKSRQNFHRNKTHLQITEKQTDNRNSYLIIKNRQFHKGKFIKFKDGNRIVRGQVLQTNTYGLIYVQEVYLRPNQLKSNRIHLILAENFILESTQLKRKKVIDQQRTLFDTLSQREKEKNR